MTGAPGGIFTAFGGALDALLVGTRNGSGNNELHALKLADGTPLASYAPGASPGPIGPINGTPTIDYATRRVYFASLAGGGDTLFCLELNASPVFTYRWSRNLGPISGSPVLRGGRLYVGTDAGLVYSLDAMTGGGDRTIVTADGPVKGFLFPDRRNDDLMFATDTKVWSISDTAPAMTVNWTWTTRRAQPVGDPLLADDEPRLRRQQERSALRARLHERDAGWCRRRRRSRCWATDSARWAPRRSTSGSRRGCWSWAARPASSTASKCRSPEDTSGFLAAGLPVTL